MSLFFANAARPFGGMLALTAGALWLGALPAGADYASEILSENPLAYYRFNDSVATDDLDRTVAENLGSLGDAGDGAFAGTNTRGIAGAVAGNNCVAFSNGAAASTAYIGSVDIPNNPALNPSHTGTNPFTVECWVKPNTNTSTLLCALSSMKSTATSRAGFLIYQNAATWQLRLGNNASATANVLNGGTVTAGQWQHLAAAYSGGTNGTMTLYVNGASVGSMVLPGAGYEANDTAPFLIGAFSVPARTFDGAIDEVAFFAAELSAARIQARYAEATANPAGYEAHVLADAPVGYWRLNEVAFVPRTPPVATNAGTLGTAADGAYYAGSKNTNTGPDSAGGFLGFGTGNSALSLQTANGHVGTTVSMLNNRANFTVCGWLKRGANKSTNGGYFGQNDLFEMGDSAGTAIAAWNPTSGTVQAPYTIADDTWGFVAVTGDATSTKLYVNGALVGNIGAPNLGTSTYFFNIGGLIWAPTGQYFRGDIDEVAVFDKALSAGRIQQLYDTALGNVAPTAGMPTVTPGTLIPEGQSYTLTVDPAGTPPFTYQWKRDGVDINGAIGKSYTVTSATVQTPVTAPFEYTVAITNAGGTYTTTPALEVFVTPGLVWDGSHATNPSFWDVGTTANWKPLSGGAATTYTNDFSVLLNDAAVTTTVAMQGDVEPQGTVFNNSAKDYTFTGEFGIGGGGGMVKNGTGVVELLNSNYLTGPTVVNNGVLKVGNGTSGTLGTATAITINGGALHLNDAPASTFTNTVTIGAAGQLAFKGTGDTTLAGGIISGAGSELFDRNGLVLVNRSNLISTATIASGEVAFTGNQEANRLANGAAITVGPNATMTVRGVNALPTAERSVNPTLNQGTLKVTSGDGSHLHLGNITLNGGTILFDNFGGTAYNNESFQLNGGILVTGTVPSAITNGTGANSANSGVALKGTKTITVEDVTNSPAADLLVSAELENTDDNVSALTKAGPGTLYLANAISHTYSGATTVNQGTLLATGSVAGPLVIESAGTIAPGDGIGTFTAGATTLSGRYVCDIVGNASDRLQVNGNVTLNAGSVIDLNAVNPNASVYTIASYTGTLTNNGTPTVTGMPAGYSLVLAFNSILIAQGGVSFSPVLTQVPGSVSSPLSSSDFNADNGGFTVSAAVSPQTDWTYTAGSWRSNGQADSLGSNNVSYLTSPPFALTKSGVFGLSFSHRYSFEFYEPGDSFDGGVVEVSINDGAFQRVPLSSFSQNGYNGTVMTGTTISLAGQPAFIGNSAGHPAFITSICKAGVGNVGDIVRVRFMSASDNNTTGDKTPPGWEIDSYEFTEGGPGGAFISWPIGILQYSDNLLPPWTDLPGATSPWFIDTTLAPSRFFRIKP